MPRMSATSKMVVGAPMSPTAVSRLLSLHMETTERTSWLGTKRVICTCSRVTGDCMSLVIRWWWIAFRSYVCPSRHTTGSRKNWPVSGHTMAALMSFVSSASFRRITPAHGDTVLLLAGLGAAPLGLRFSVTVFGDPLGLLLLAPLPPPPPRSWRRSKSTWDRRSAASALARSSSISSSSTLRTVLRFGFVVTSFALAPKRIVDSVSASLKLFGEHVRHTNVRAFPPRLFSSSRVSLLLRKGTCIDACFRDVCRSDSAVITLPSACSERLIEVASSRRSPAASVLATFSEPARSTRYSCAFDSTSVSRSFVMSVTSTMAWLRDDCRFDPVAAVARDLRPSWTTSIASCAVLMSAVRQPLMKTVPCPPSRTSSFAFGFASSFAKRHMPRGACVRLKALSPSRS
mmetsp:Transcript_52457/g.161500  ORF Transcript_52457/g.161500 Transcript_52457/m.161500 type:complete len:402 (+) Transcript_52457:457-1662(+)